MSAITLSWPWRRVALRPPVTETEFAYRPDDMLVVSYPHSGSAWLRLLIASLQSMRTGFRACQQLVPEISPAAARHGVEYELLPSPRFLRSYSLYREQFPRVIYLVRDGRDALVTYYEHHRRRHAFEGSLLEFLESDLRPNEWDEHVASWLWENPRAAQWCVVRFEALRLDPLGELDRVARFAGLQCSTAQLQRAVTNAMGTLGNRRPTEDRVGGWREVCGTPERDWFAEHYGATLAHTGYEQDAMSFVPLD